MDIKVNNINFNGKQEIAYGLNKIAENARLYEKTKELAYGPNPTIHYEDLKNISGKLEGYTDMVIHDTSLDMSMSSLTKK